MNHGKEEWQIEGFDEIRPFLTLDEVRSSEPLFSFSKDAVGTYGSSAFEVSYDIVFCC
jgi:hypothetical protein